MYQFNLLDIVFYPGANLVGKIALTIKYNRFCLLMINIACYNSTVNKVEEIKKLIVGIKRNILNHTSTFFKRCFESFINRFSCEEYDAFVVANCLCNECMNFFCTARMVKRKEEEYVVLFFQWIQFCH